MPVLYRKYRPQTFAEVIGQDHVTRTLKHAVAGDVLAHAYLFTGSRGVGKTTVARILAKAVNCEHPKKGEPDGTCAICRTIAEGRFLDIVEIDAASNTGVENVRELIEQVRFQPGIGRFKVFIIDEVHMLSKAAFNALLKTLEEPPAHVLFVLATTEVHKVPATIISRTQRLDFRRLTPAQISEGLNTVLKNEKISVGSDVVAVIADHAEGSLRDALSLLDKVLTLGSEPKLEDVQVLLGLTDQAANQELMTLIAGGKVEQLPEFFERLTQRGLDFVVMNREFLRYLRLLLIGKISGNGEPAGVSVRIKNLSASELIYVIRLFLRAVKESSLSPNPELPLLLASVEAGLRYQASSARAEVPVSRPAAASTAKSSASRPSEARQSERESGLDAVTLDEARQFWPDVLEKLKGINSPLGTLLKNSPLAGVNEGSLVVEVRYLFHKEQLEAKKNYAVIVDLIHQASGKNLGLQASLVKEPLSVNSTLDAISDALKVFGGELVE